MQVEHFTTFKTYTQACFKSIVKVLHPQGRLCVIGAHQHGLTLLQQTSYRNLTFIHPTLPPITLTQPATLNLQHHLSAGQYQLYTLRHAQPHPTASSIRHDGTADFHTITLAIAKACHLCMHQHMHQLLNHLKNKPSTGSALIHDTHIEQSLGEIYAHLAFAEPLQQDGSHTPLHTLQCQAHALCLAAERMCLLHGAHSLTPYGPRDFAWFLKIWSLTLKCAHT